MELLCDVEAGCRVLLQNCASSWWKWDSGSALNFWRWATPAQRRAARDGPKVFVHTPLPRLTKRARLPIDKSLLELMGQKLNDVRRKGYISPGPVLLHTDYFSVPKGDSDIRMAYNGTLCGLNDCIFAPNFALPTPEQAALSLTPESFCVDLDLGEMFLNFPLDKALRPYAGVNLTGLKAYLGVSKEGALWERWDRLFMGFRPSPFLSCRFYHWAAEVAEGNPTECKNPLRYDKVLLNLPGDPRYDPTKPWVMKWN